VDRTAAGADRMLLMGAGKAEAFDGLAAEHAAAAAYNAVKASGLTTLRIQLPKTAAETTSQAALGVRLTAYRFDRYRTKEPADRKPSLLKAQVVADDTDAALTGFADEAALADAVAFARDLVSEPANILHPVEFAGRVKELERLGLAIEVLGEDEMAKLGMG